MVYFNFEVFVVGIDLSSGVLGVVKERCSCLGVFWVEFYYFSIYDMDKLEGEFDFINCVGVLYYLLDLI